MHKRLTVFLVITLIAGLAVASDGGTRSDLTPKDLQRVRSVTAPTTDFARPENFEQLSAGAATVKKRVNRDIFSFSSANLSFAQEETFKLGNGLFTKLWVSAPASTEASDGLGPLFNARGCQNCHLKDGRGHTPAGPDDDAASMFLRLSIPPRDDADRAALAAGAKVIAEPTYGGQLQNFAIQGIRPEGWATARW